MLRFITLPLCLVTLILAEGDAIKRVGELGGKVAYDEQKNVVGIDLLQRQPTDQDLKPIAGLGHLTSLKLYGSGITDAGMPYVATLSKLTDLVLENTAVTDKGLKELRPLANLKSLNLRRSATTDEGLRYVAEFAKLEQLHLLFTGTSNAGLKHIAGMTGLRILDLRGCVQVSDSGIAELK